MEQGRYGSRAILNTQVIDYATNEPIMYMDYATSATNEWTSETVYARGGNGNPKRIAWNGEKGATLTIETQIFTMEHLALLAGEEIVTGPQTIYKREVLTVQEDGSGGKKVKLSKAPQGGSTAVSVFAFTNGVKGAAQEVKTVTGSDIALSDKATVAAGEEVEVYYQFQSASANKLSFTAKGFPKYVKIVGDTLYADEAAGEMVPMQMTYYKAKLQPNFTLAMSPTGDPSSLTLTFDIFPVKVNGTDTLADMIIYEE
ncbi:hypothetical protein L3476_28985 [Paenibacillus thiaminolyticus]|uniref:hypothetical protein n=1 Tax=Paenibacillus thiaminolyticus TaxID=49283 RepID=UPI002350F888|nr:hypothetical protein [Paenibacillus thiaminolyticus]MDG0874533.1 hypothetical protein [Paenibacillus thiaminolyticus]WCR27153.1 hypothetical protein L3476_28985 [Paenibacillus thiaminolyticus]